MTQLQAIIEAAFNRREPLTSASSEPELREAVANTLALLDKGELRVAEKIAGEWVVHLWVKKALLLSTKLIENSAIAAQVVSTAVVSPGAYVAGDATLLLSFVNLGAFIDQGTRVQTWASIGACTQVGKNVHLCDGVTLGGSLEPLESRPTIIEDNCYIGAQAAIAAGVVVKEGAVIGMGVRIDQGTRIYDRQTGETYYSQIPAGSVVVPGSLPSNCGSYSLHAAIIVKKVDAQTRGRVGVQALLRGAM